MIIFSRTPHLEEVAQWFDTNMPTARPTVGHNLRPVLSCNGCPVVFSIISIGLVAKRAGFAAVVVVVVVVAAAAFLSTLIKPGALVR